MVKKVMDERRLKIKLMLKELELRGKKKIGDSTPEEWESYVKLVQEFLKEIAPMFNPK